MSSLLRRAALLLLLLTLFSAAAGCAGTEQGPEETSPGSSAGTLREEPESLVICDASDQSLKYTIIRGMSAGPKEIQAAVDLNKALRDRSPDGWKMSISDDFVAGVDKKTAVENDDPEILVGSTNRKESRDAIGALPENGYVIAAVGRKIVIAGSGELATLKAMELFIETYIEGTPSSSVEIPLPLNITGVIADSREPLAEGASLRLMSWNLGCAVGVAEDAVSVIETYRADIIALQECNAEIHTGVIGVFLKDFDYYSHVQEKHSGSSTYNYTPILYNTKLLTLVEAGVEWLDGRYTGTNTKSLCWAVFDEIFTGRRFMMVNFHGAVCSGSYKGYESMSSDERNAIANNWRIDNVRQILDVRSRIAAKYGDLPMTVNGDCNFNENSTPYANLTAAGFADCEKTAEKIITTGYKTSYSYGTGIPGAGLSIDHIFGTGGVRFVSFDIIRLQKVATASDHTPIYTDYCP